MTDHVFDLLVVGGGTAGIVGAKTAARMGARVLLVERDRTGGDCLWTGCVPSKSLLAAGSAAAGARGGARLGVHAEGVRVDFPAVMRHVRGARDTIAPVDSPEALEQEGVEVWSGELSFTGPDRARVDTRSVRFLQALVATGARPTVPPIDGLAEADVLTSENVWDLDELPERLLVLGGGTIGCELGQAFTRLGAAVTVVEGGERLLSAEDPIASAAVRSALEADGATVLTGQELTRVHPEGAGGRAELADGTELAYDRLLVAVGRRPGTEGLGLEAAGVELDDRGSVRVDDHLRTTNPRIWAAGDLTGHPQFTHVAGVHGALAASNAVLGVRRSVDTSAVPRVTFTDPEVAAVGVSTHDPGEGRQVLTVGHEHVDRAVTEARTGGTTRLVVDGRGRVVGATVVGPRAGETIGELTVAVARGLRTRDLAGVTHPYPTWNDGAWNGAIGDVRERLGRPPISPVLSGMVRARRWWLRRR